MFEGLEDIAAAWRTIVHISEWSGLSVGALVGGGALIYLVPASRKLVILAAVNVVIGWLCLIHGDRVGRADLQKQWDAARATALEEQTARDSKVALDLDAKYQPKLKLLLQQAEDNKARADTYESKLLTVWTANAAAPRKAAVSGACELGAAADRVPKRK